MVWFHMKRVLVGSGQFEVAPAARFQDSRLVPGGVVSDYFLETSEVGHSRFVELVQPHVVEVADRHVVAVQDFPDENVLLRRRMAVLLGVDAKVGRVHPGPVIAHGIALLGRVEAVEENSLHVLFRGAVENQHVGLSLIRYRRLSQLKALFMVDVSDLMDFHFEVGRRLLVVVERLQDGGVVVAAHWQLATFEQRTLFDL